jgi:hypothetical protein
MILSRAEVAARVHVTSAPAGQHSSAADRCVHALLEVGSRDGSGMLKVARPEQYWDVTAPFNWWKNLMLVLAPDKDPAHLCLPGNPSLAPRLRTLAEGSRADGMRCGTVAGVHV